jgi:hypothetical protein
MTTTQPTHNFRYPALVFLWRCAHRYPGYRFVRLASTGYYGWRHPADMQPGDTDLTDLGETALDQAVTAAEEASQ